MEHEVKYRFRGRGEEIGGELEDGSVGIHGIFRRGVEEVKRVTVGNGFGHSVGGEVLHRGHIVDAHNGFFHQVGIYVGGAVANVDARGISEDGCRVGDFGGAACGRSI